MRQKITLSTLVIFLLFFVACKKDSAKGPLDGNWNFTSIQAHDSTSNHYNDGSDELDVALIDYLTTNNKGTVSIGGGAMAYKGLTYSIDTVSTYRSYTDGLLTDEFTAPFLVDLPLTSAASTFKLVGADSLYFPQGGIVSIGGSVQSSVAAGYKYTLSGNTLTMTTNLVKDSTNSLNGYPTQVHVEVKATVTLTRQ